MRVRCSICGSTHIIISGRIDLYKENRRTTIYECLDCGSFTNTVDILNKPKKDAVSRRRRRRNTNLRAGFGNHLPGGTPWFGGLSGSRSSQSNHIQPMNLSNRSPRA